MLLLIVPALATLLFAAHLLFHLSGTAGLAVPQVAAWLAAALVPMFVRRPWACKLLQALLGAATLEWIRTAAALAMHRIALGEPWMRATVIVGTCGLLTAAGALLLARARRLKAWYRLS